MEADLHEVKGNSIYKYLESRVKYLENKLSRVEIDHYAATVVSPSFDS